jgi:hypothetical protein
MSSKWKVYFLNHVMHAVTHILISVALLKNPLLTTAFNFNIQIVTICLKINISKNNHGPQRERYNGPHAACSLCVVQAYISVYDSPRRIL